MSIGEIMTRQALPRSRSERTPLHAYKVRLKEITEEAILSHVSEHGSVVNAKLFEVNSKRQKHRGEFQHSSFLPGSTTIAVGRFSAENGVIKVRSFTKENYYEDPVPNDSLNPASAIMGPNLPQVVLPQTPQKAAKEKMLLHNKPSRPIKEPYQVVCKASMKSKSESNSYELGHRLSLKWSTGAGPRIGCFKDYLLEMVDL
ncbi:hypothetical protein U9M48_034122 [Paspalum notatum var. saurae]|uniref:Uncharacterized protein n=1 Tax=Paspalum notatum var. saurae TaxID=547442 RepID=A0AAQ3X7K8_PASNO